MVTQWTVSAAHSSSEALPVTDRILVRGAVKRTRTEAVLYGVLDAAPLLMAGLAVAFGFYQMAH